VIGATGTGKSSLCNTLCDATLSPADNKFFETSPEGDSKTLICKLHQTRWLGDPGEDETITVVDTPGLNDSSNRDAHLMTVIRDCVVNELGSVNYLLLNLDSTNTRLDSRLKEIIKVFILTFGQNEVFSNLGIVYNRWSSL
jgi:predicted GTPase